MEGEVDTQGLCPQDSTSLQGRQVTSQPHLAFSLCADSNYVQ